MEQVAEYEEEIARTQIKHQTNASFPFLTGAEGETGYFFLVDDEGMSKIRIVMHAKLTPLGSLSLPYLALALDLAGFLAKSPKLNIVLFSMHKQVF